MPTDIDLLDRHLPSHTALPARESEDDPVNLGAFGWLRGVRDRAVMPELRRKDGSVALAYAWLERADFDPSQGITLKFGAEKVKITGRNLNAEGVPTSGSLWVSCGTACRGSGGRPGGGHASRAGSNGG